MQNDTGFNRDGKSLTTTNTRQKLQAGEQLEESTRQCKAFSCLTKVQGCGTETDGDLLH
jgi:hypothetical protein